MLELVDQLQGEWKILTRRACAVLQIDPSLYVYKSKRGTQTELTRRIRDICATRVRYGYRRVHILLQRDGWAVNPKRIYRRYKELGMQLRNKMPTRAASSAGRRDA
ncbi:IS3 family transposase [Acetobacter sp.]|uniref:IS3 family transposase n=1 Tax=Acetobacter sp. TaxID=440 RepID=UPI0039E9681D